MSEQKRRGRIAGAGKIEPWAVPDYDIADVAALQAVYFGRASEDQQRRAYTFIMHKLCCVGELSFRPPDIDPRGLAMAFAQGKCFVGQQLIKFAQLNLALLRGKQTEQGEAPKENKT